MKEAAHAQRDEARAKIVGRQPAPLGGLPGRGGGRLLDR
jgi:hypothetical protein